MFLVNRASDGEWKDTVCVHTVENATSSSPAKKKKKKGNADALGCWIERVCFFAKVCLAKTGARRFSCRLPTCGRVCPRVWMCCFAVHIS